MKVGSFTKLGVSTLNWLEMKQMAISWSMPFEWVNYRGEDTKWHVVIVLICLELAICEYWKINMEMYMFYSNQFWEFEFYYYHGITKILVWMLITSTYSLWIQNYCDPLGMVSIGKSFPTLWNEMVLLNILSKERELAYTRALLIHPTKKSWNNMLHKG